MEFIKKQSLGFYLSIITAVIAIFGLILYLQNCKTAYFSNLGVNTIVVVCFTVAICVELIFIIAQEVVGEKMILDACPVVTGILLTIGSILFISSRVNGIAAIMTFTNNASTMADLKHTVISIAFCVAGMLFTMVSSFFKVVK